MTSAAPRKKVIVIGAGVGGTSTAARLAAAGLEVDVYEKNSYSGGRCSLIHHDGYRFDQGPSLLLLRPLFEQLYSDLGTKLDDWVNLVQCNPNYVIHYHDGEKVTLSSDRAVMQREMKKWEGEEGVERLDGFLREASIHGELSYNLVLSKTFPSLFSLLRPSFIRNVIRLHPFGSLYGRCARYFRTERMRRAFSFGSMYLGSSPFDSPGTYSLLQWTETCEGIWYPIGGFHAVIQSVVDIATSQEIPAKFHFDTPVAEVIHENGKAKGVRLESGEVKEADVVIVNADLVWAHNNLFKRHSTADGEKKELVDPGLAKRLLDKPHSCSSISFYWAMDSVIPSLNTHNIFLAKDYKGSFDDIFKAHSMPREPSFYVNVPTRIDPSAAPQGKDALVVLVPVGHLLPTSSSSSGKSVKTFSDSGAGEPNVESQDWDSLVERARRQVIETMEGRLGIAGLRDKIKWEGVNTPLSWKDKFNLTHGSILGITHDFFNVLAFRHQARHRSIKSAYFVGASTHPGTGVPIAIAGSRLCAEAVLADLGIPVPDTYAKAKRTPRSTLDEAQPRPALYVMESFISLLLPYWVGASISLLATGGVLWHYGILRPQQTFERQQTQAFPYHNLMTMKSDQNPILMLLGTVLILTLSLGYRLLSRR